MKKSIIAGMAALMAVAMPAMIDFFISLFDVDHTKIMNFIASVRIFI